MKICIFGLIVLLVCQSGCAGDIINKNEVISLKITKLSNDKSLERTLTIKDRSQIYLIVKIVNGCHREPMIMPVHFKIEVQYETRAITIFAMKNNIKIDGTTYKVSEDLGAILEKMIE